MAAQQRLRPDGFTVPFSRLAQHRWAAVVGRCSRVAESSSAHVLTGAAACPEATRRRHATCGMSCPAPNPAAVPAQPPLPCPPNRRCRARPTAAPSRRKLPALEKAEAAGWLERSASFCSTASEGDPDSELGRPAATAISGAQLSLLWGRESREWLCPPGGSLLQRGAGAPWLPLLPRIPTSRPRAGPLEDCTPWLPRR